MDITKITEQAWEQIQKQILEEGTTASEMPKEIASKIKAGETVYLVKNNDDNIAIGKFFIDNNTDVAIEEFFEPKKIS